MATPKKPTTAGPKKPKTKKPSVTGSTAQAWESGKGIKCAKNESE